MKTPNLGRRVADPRDKEKREAGTLPEKNDEKINLKPWRTTSNV
jgi:hypothetical protein